MNFDPKREEGEPRIARMGMEAMLISIAESAAKALFALIKKATAKDDGR